MEKEIELILSIRLRARLVFRSQAGLMWGFRRHSRTHTIRYRMKVERELPLDGSCSQH